MKKLPIYIVLALALTSCIYPFTADLDGDIDRRLVVTGDIRIGEMTEITLAYLTPINEVPDQNVYPSAGMVIENDKGQTFRTESRNKSTYYFNTRTADPDAKYRVRFNETNLRREYATPWMEVHRAPQIKEVRCGLTDKDAHIMISMDGNGEDRWFCWDYEQTWEFHADLIPELMYDASAKPPYRERLPEEDYYYCWASSNSRETALTSTEKLTANKVVDFDFLQIPRTDRRLSVLYSIEVDVRAVSKDGWTYMDNLVRNSNNTGSLFSPVPSDIRGNIRCTSDSTEVVIGYVDAYVPVKYRMFVESGKVYKGLPVNEDQILFIPEPDEDGKIDYDWYYNVGNAPYGEYEINGEAGIYWAPTRCLDCRKDGGSKNKPSYWPNDHI